jgi:hypothetical protein
VTAAQKYHINNSGDVRACSVTTGTCPFGGSENHFRTKDEANFFKELSAGQVEATILPGLNGKGERVAQGTGLLIHPSHASERAKIKTRFYWFPLPDSSRVAIVDTQLGQEYTTWVNRGHATASVSDQALDAVRRGAFDYNSAKPEGTFSRDRLGVEGGYREIEDEPKPKLGYDFTAEDLMEPQPAVQPAPEPSYDWLQAETQTTVPAAPKPPQTFNWLGEDTSLRAAPQPAAPNRLFSRVLGRKRVEAAPVAQLPEASVWTF